MAFVKTQTLPIHRRTSITKKIERYGIATYLNPDLTQQPVGMIFKPAERLFIEHLIRRDAPTQKRRC